MGEMNPEERNKRNEAQETGPPSAIPANGPQYEASSDRYGITKAAMQVLKLEERGLRLGSSAGASDSEEDNSPEQAAPYFQITAKYGERLSRRRAELPPSLPAPLVRPRKKLGRPRKHRPESPEDSPASQTPSEPQRSRPHTPTVIPSSGLVSSFTATPSYTAPDADVDMAEQTASPSKAGKRATTETQPATEPKKTRRESAPPASQATQITIIKGNRHRLIQRIAVQFKNALGDAPGSSKLPDAEQIKLLSSFLTYLDVNVQMTPQIQAATFIGQGLDIITDPKYGFPAEFVDRANALRAKWDATNWGAPEPGVGGDDDYDNDEEEAIDTASSRGGSSAPRAPHRDTVDHLPATDHPIYGNKGIMAGVIITKSKISDDAKHGRTVYRRHPFFPQKSAQVFGHNGLAVGSWWPLQIAALVSGAHGSSQGGISGSERAGGAYSIVVSGGNPQYHELDDDRGDTVFYSGSRSHANRDPKKFAEPANHFTQALVASWKNRKPVRVLRSAPAGGNSSKRAALGAAAFPSRWSPCLGIRYDGLYTIVNMTAAVNEFGGLYERFELRRNPGQTPLEEVRKTSPTAKQRADFLKIPEGY